MPRCSICQTRYSTNKPDRCPSCGWDVEPISFVTGLIPEVAQKEAVRLEWGKQMWSKILRQKESNQIQIDRAHQIQIQLEKADRENAALRETLRQQETLIQLLRNAPEAEVLDAEAPAIASVQPSIDLNATHAPPELLPELTTRVAVPVESPFSIALGKIEFKQVLLTAEGRQIQIKQASYFRQSLSENTSLDMIVIPGGRFWMGSPETENGRSINESPQHAVTISPFCMSRFPITQAQWRSVATLPKVNRSLSSYPANFEGDDRPVEQVTWYDAVEFCARLSAQTGQHYRLPSEAEWEYACRAETTTPFHFGNTIMSDLANYDGTYTYGFESRGEYRHETTPVAAFGIANSFGVCDLHGNVWEWCADAWHETYQGAPIEGQAWQAEDGASYRVLRGGAWYCLPELCRSAQRHWNQPDMGGSGIGFRVVCAAT